MIASKSRLREDSAISFQSKVHDKALKGVSPSTLYSESLVCSTCYAIYGAIDKYRRKFIWKKFSDKMRDTIRTGSATSYHILRRGVRPFSTKLIESVAGHSENESKEKAKASLHSLRILQDLHQNMTLDPRCPPISTETKDGLEEGNVRSMDGPPDVSRKNRVKERFLDKSVILSIERLDGLETQPSENSELITAFTMQGSSAFS